MPPPKRPGLKQNLVAKVIHFYQSAKKNKEKVTFCCKIWNFPRGFCLFDTDILLLYHFAGLTKSLGTRKQVT